MMNNSKDRLFEFHRDDSKKEFEKKIRFFSLWFHILEKMSKSSDFDDLDNEYNELLKNATSFEEVDAIDYFYGRIKKELESRFGKTPEDVRNSIVKFIREYMDK